MTSASFDHTFDIDQSGKTTILLADDHPLLLQALRSLLEKESDFEIIGEAADGEEAIMIADKLVPNVVIMDIGLPKLNGLEATRQIKEKHPEIVVLVLTVYNDNEHILGILEAGAAGYLTKNALGKEVINAIRSVVTGDTVLSRSAFQQILSYALRYITKPLPLEAGDTLTVRELEVITLAAMGMSNKDIALKLGLSYRTVKGYFSEIFSKLEVGSRTEAVLTALRAGFIKMNDIQ